MPHDADQMDARLLDIMQACFPLTARPFQEIAARVGIAEDEVISRVLRLKTDGVIRQIGAIFDSAALGYRGALVAFRVRDGLLDEVAQAVAAHPGVSHCYSRAAGYNLWFTITLPPSDDLEQVTAGLASLDGVESHMLLPALRVYKIGVFLRMSSSPLPIPQSAIRNPQSTPSSQLSGRDRAAVSALQRDLPVVSSPFAELAREARMEEEELLNRARSLLQSGVMRRYAAVLRHQRAGFRANAMVCWHPGDRDIDELGSILAAETSVSHCYQRPAYPDWPYTLYTMVHARDDAELGAAIARLAESSGLRDYLVLHSLTEYKKTRVRYE